MRILSANRRRAFRRSRSIVDLSLDALDALWVAWERRHRRGRSWRIAEAERQAVALKRVAERIRDEAWG